MKIVKLIRISHDELRDCIRLAYSDDEEMRSIHILEGGTLSEMTEYTWHQSVQDAEIADTKFYKVALPTGEAIGYTTLVLHPAKILFTFGLNIHYRKRDILDGWMKAVEQRLGYSFVLTLRKKNVRAMKFFQRRGFEVKEDNDNNQFIVWRHQR